LASDDLPVTAIASDVEFGDLSNFVRTSSGADEVTSMMLLLMRIVSGGCGPEASPAVSNTASAL